MTAVSLARRSGFFIQEVSRGDATNFAASAVVLQRGCSFEFLRLNFLRVPRASLASLRETRRTEDYLEKIR